MERFEAVINMSKQLPMHSKVILSAYHDSYCAKIVGYHEDQNYVLLYNPSISGHSGYGVAINDLLIPLSSKYLNEKYGEHLFYYPIDTVLLLAKPVWSIYEEEVLNG